MLLWTLLLTSSVPLHFLFNSVVFARIQANDYQVLPVTDNFFNGHNYDTSEFTAVDNSFNLSEAEVLRDKFKTLKTDNLTAHECLEAYNSQYVSQHGDVLIFQNQIVWHSPANYSPVWNDSSYYEWVKISWPLTTNLNYDDHLPYQSFADVFPANGWRCPSRSIQDCHITRTAEIPANGSWAPYGSPVSHCLVEKVEEVCKLQFSLKIAIIVIICNFVKVCCMFTVAFRYYNHYVVTVGDAISYFLDEPEAETKGRCIHERRDFRLEWEWKEIQLSQSPNKPRKYNPEKLRWYNAANGKRWIISYLSYWGSLVFAIIAIDKSLAGMPSNIKDLWATGFGQLQGNNLLHTRTSIMGGVLLANAPQVILSYLYVSFNALLTRMLVQRELACYKQSIKPLRVTFPTGQQRSTFWLQLPYRYAIPLNITSVLLHWLASQSLFMVSVTIISRDRKPDYKREISTCGYSPVAIIFTTCVGCIIMISGIVMAYRKFPGGMPLMSSSSAAISAACHPPENDTGAAQLPVQWGVAKEGQGEDGVGHITFTSFDVTVPIPGKLYA
ncbi:uncharacterized protein K452DRAFT_236653 [Aplosporella prunicola CBS 121167]|uniref:DUF6536 domain-containing protein n=1 Tax=Aplosporella prunicola CBS 121167 TaxID=1176127 RepID=A0A6A6AYC0_9PEZI|nr:uncharacterized protein K452DRAFT_236653 [Aplosporella prunicola CBS 121167]KAF2136929.1 hypothetical protein K452DRAFT_236653 [Aplosporella prunicola CBS 121167]